MQTKAWLSRIHQEVHFKRMTEHVIGKQQNLRCSETVRQTDHDRFSWVRYDESFN